MSVSSTASSSMSAASTGSTTKALLANKSINITRDDPEKHYQLVEIIGTGSYGEVFKGRSVATGEIMAVKIIKLEPGEELDEVLNEVNFLQSCSHRNIVAYGGCFMKKGHVKGEKQIWIVMEFCGGGSVEAIYKAMRAPLTEREIAVVVRESLEGLAFLHSVSKIHRDIKAGNILLSETGGIKLADFGVSTQLTKTFSKSNTFIGTPYWMAPEVITAEQSNSSYGVQADIWSLGVTTIEMAECSPPMFDMHPMRVLFMIPKMQPPTLREPGKWTPDFHSFLAACLVKDPEQRPTAQTLLKHPFVAPRVNGPAIVIELIERARVARQSWHTASTSSGGGMDGAESDGDDASDDDDGVGSQNGDDEEDGGQSGTIRRHATEEILGGSSATTTPVKPPNKALPPTAADQNGDEYLTIKKRLPANTTAPPPDALSNGPDATTHMRAESAVSSLGSMLRPTTAASVLQHRDVPASNSSAAASMEDISAAARNMTMRPAQKPAVAQLQGSDRDIHALSSDSMNDGHASTESVVHRVPPAKVDNSTGSNPARLISATSTTSPPLEHSYAISSPPPLVSEPPPETTSNGVKTSTSPPPQYSKLQPAASQLNAQQHQQQAASPSQHNQQQRESAKNLLQAHPPSRLSTLSTALGPQPQFQPPSINGSHTPAKALAPFKAGRLCRLGRKINCAEYVNDCLLLGLDEGLFLLETAPPPSDDPSVPPPAAPSTAPAAVKMTSLSSRRYVKLDCMEEIGGILVSRSGKNQSICVHECAGVDRAKMIRKFEDETHVKKLKEAKEIDWHSISRVKTDVYLSIARGKSILLMKWAPQPLNKFMKVKDVSADGKPLCMDVVDSTKSDGRLFVGTEKHGFRVADFATGSSQLEPVKGQILSESGRPVKTVDIGGGLIILCYAHFGLLTSADNPGEEVLKRFSWRQSPLTFAAHLNSVTSAQNTADVHTLSRNSSKSSLRSGYNQSTAGQMAPTAALLVAGSEMTVDIWSVDSGKIVHIFETKKDRIRRLDFLLVRNNCRLLLLADEEKDGQQCSSIITIFQEGVEKREQQRRRELARLSNNNNNNNNSSNNNSNNNSVISGDTRTAMSRYSVGASSHASLDSSK